jgi:hypothetical protein
MQDANVPNEMFAYIFAPKIGSAGMSIFSAYEQTMQFKLVVLWQRAVMNLKSPAHF